tara:strand:- start:6058 stop:6759 length:702 start_codon:yes stop_codon:yes gene_type:complete
MQTRTVTIAIPTYDNKDGGKENLNHLLESIERQDYPKNLIDVVISDHSTSNVIEKLCDKFSKTLNISYYRNEKDRGYWGSNLNNAIKNSKGSIIKPMLQDDYFFHDSFIDIIVSTYEENNFKWAMCEGIHTQDYYYFYNNVIPRYTEDIHKGNNKLGGPSGLILYNCKGLPMFEKLNWMGDCDYYKRCFQIYGEPTIINSACVVYKQWAGQMTHTLTAKQKQLEVDYVNAKYE